MTDAEKEAGHEFIWVNSIKGGAIPKEYISSIEAGCLAEFSRGYVAGFPIIGAHMELIDGSYHDVDSSEMAFRAAGALAIREALPKLGVELLEPWMKVEVETPDEFTGTVIGSLNAKRAMISETEARGVTTVVRGETPLGEMFGYTTDLRSMSQGRAAFTMEPGDYKSVPRSMVEKIAKKA